MQQLPLKSSSYAPHDSLARDSLRGAARSDAPANPTTRDACPEVIPARMLNEFVYCPRLFYLEFVEGVFVRNADTLEGAAAHKRVDAKATGLPENKDDKDLTGDAEKEKPETVHARSVSLYSESLRVTAKLDLAEVRAAESDDLFGGFSVQPVEYKKGHPREGEDGIEIWPADQMQLGLQILLLRENGYTCDRGILYYRETRQRVPFELTAEREAWVRAQIATAREAMLGPRPAPLDDSPKCPRCSLVGVCLPDETRALLPQAPATATPDFQGLLPGLSDNVSGSTPPPDRLNWGAFANLPEVKLLPRTPSPEIRRLVAPNSDTRALYLHTPGHFLGKKGDTLVVKEKGKAVADFRLHDLHHVALFGPIQVSTGVIQELCQRDIPLTYFSMGGWFYGLTRGHAMTNVMTRIEQFAAAADPTRALGIARLLIFGKIKNQRTLLMRNHAQPEKGLLKGLAHLARASLYAPSLATLLGFEGQAASLYFAALPGMLKQRQTRRDGREEPQTPEHTAHTHNTWLFDFHTRNRRPARDPVNAVLNLVYSLLTKEATLACHAVGFDPYVGFLHQPRYGRPALALDLMEEFRPLVADSAILALINNNRLSASDFIHAGDSVVLTPKARKTVFRAFEKRLQDHVTHPVFQYKVSYRRALELQARLLAKTLTGEIEQYLPFTTR